MDYGHGCHPACVGKIPDSHLIFGGEEWWFYDAPIRPGDKLFQNRRFAGYDVKDTSFAGPTVFTRCDTEHRNQHGVLVARARATARRYLREAANTRAVYGKDTASQKRQPQHEHPARKQLRDEGILLTRAGNTQSYDAVP